MVYISHVHVRTCHQDAGSSGARAENNFQLDGHPEVTSRASIDQELSLPASPQL